MVFVNSLMNSFIPSRNSTFRVVFLEMDRRLNTLGLDFSKPPNKIYYQKIRAIAQILPLIFGYYLCAVGFVTTKIQDEKFISYFVGTSLSINIVPKFAHLYLYHEELNYLKKKVIENTNESNMKQFGFEIEILRKYNRKMSLVAFIFIILFTTQCIFCCFGPFLIDKNEMPLPVYLEVPGLSNREHPGYEISFLMCAYHTYYAMQIVLGLDLAFYVIVLYIAYRLDVCQEMVLRIGDKSTDYSTDARQHKLIRDSIILHMETSQFAAKFISSFSMMIFFQIAATLLLMTTTMTSFKNNFVLSFSVFVAYAFQFLLYCFFGELIVTKFKELSNSLYCSYWYNLNSIKERKLILFLLLQSSQTISVSTYGLFELSLDTFAVVSKAAYGYFTFLQNVL